MTTEDERRLLDRVKPYEVNYLYKYRSLDSRGLEEIFSQNQIYLSDPLAFNDPFDCRPKIVTHKSRFKRNQFYRSIIERKFPRYRKDQIKKELKNNPMFRKIKTHEYLQESFLIFIRGFGLYCLSEIPDDILMWAHYSDSHKGICLQFNANIERTLFWEAYKVTYQNNYPSVNIMNLGEYDQFFNLFATKSNHWKYEKERRIIKTPDEGGPKLYGFHPELLTGVILGAKISAEAQKEVNKWISNSKTPINVYKATINKSLYKLDIKGINC